MWRIIGEIFGVSRALPLFNALARKFNIVKFGLKKLETSLYRVVQAHFDNFEPFKA